MKYEVCLFSVMGAGKFYETKFKLQKLFSRACQST